MAFPISVTLCNGLRGALTFQQWWTVDTLWLQKGQEKCVMGIQTWCGLGSVKNKYGKKLYTIFWDAFGYPGQPHGVAILGSEFPGPHHFHIASRRQRGTKGTCSGTTNCTQFVTARNDSSHELLWILTSENQNDSWDLPHWYGWDFCPLQWQKRAALVAVNHCLLTRTINSMELLIFSFQNSAESYFSTVWTRFLLYQARHLCEKIYDIHQYTIYMAPPGATATIRGSHAARSRFQTPRDNRWQAANSERAFSVGQPSASIRLFFLFLPDLLWFHVKGSENL